MDFYPYGDEDYGDYSVPAERTIANIFYMYVSPFMLAVGILCNLCSVIVMRRLNGDCGSTCLYLAILATMDILILCVRCGNDWLAKVAGIDISNMLMVHSRSVCKVYPFVFNFCVHFSRWLIIAIATEVLATTWRPALASRWCRPERSKAVILLLVLLLVLINVHYFWTFELMEKKQYETKGYYCKFVDGGTNFGYSREFQETVWPIMELCIGEVLPYVTVIFVGICLLCHQIFNCRKAASLQIGRAVDPPMVVQLRSTVLVLCLFYLLLMLPKFGYFILMYIVATQELYNISDNFEDQGALAHVVCSMLEYTFFSFKFFVYCCTSCTFWAEFKKLIRCKHWQQKKPTMHNHRHHSSQRPLMTPRTKSNSNNIEYANEETLYTSL